MTENHRMRKLDLDNADKLNQICHPLIEYFTNVGQRTGCYRTIILEPELSVIFSYLAMTKLADNLYGISQKNNVYENPNYIKVRYSWGKASDTHYPNSFFSGVLCHHSSLTLQLIKESFRILTAGGYFYILYDSSSRYLQKQNIVQELRGKGFHFEGEIILNVEESIVLAFKSTKTGINNVYPQSIYLKSYSHGNGGLTKHCEILKYRFKNDYGIECLDMPYDGVSDSIVIIEHHPGLVGENTLIDDIRMLKTTGNVVFIELHSVLRISKDNMKFLEKNAILLYRSIENATEDYAETYKVFPIITYSHIKIKKSTENQLILGTFGFPFKHKGLDEIINFSIKEGIPIDAYLSINNETENNKLVTSREIARLQSNQSKMVRIYTEFLDDVELAERLAKCTHILFGNKGGFDASGTMQFAKRLHRPIISIDSLQSKMAQTYRVSFFASRILAIKREAILLARSVLAHRKYGGGYMNLWGILKNFFKAIFSILLSNKLTKERLLQYNQMSREEDGMDYLISYISDLGQFNLERSSESLKS